MEQYIELACFSLIGFGVWIVILKLWSVFREKTPVAIQARLYTLFKNLPQDLFNLVAACVFWISLGALVLGFILDLVGLSTLMPSASWAAPVVGYFIFAALLSFWEGPDRKDPIPPRGRGLGQRGDKSSPSLPSLPASSKVNTRGRTIRSYHDIK